MSSCFRPSDKCGARPRGELWRGGEAVRRTRRHADRVVGNLEESSHESPALRAYLRDRARAAVRRAGSAATATTTASAATASAATTTATTTAADVEPAAAHGAGASIRRPLAGYDRPALARSCRRNGLLHLPADHGAAFAADAVGLRAIRGQHHRVDQLRAAAAAAAPAGDTGRPAGKSARQEVAARQSG